MHVIHLGGVYRRVIGLPIGSYIFTVVEISWLLDTNTIIPIKIICFSRALISEASSPVYLLIVNF